MLALRLFPVISPTPELTMLGFLMPAPKMAANLTLDGWTPANSTLASMAE